MGASLQNLVQNLAEEGDDKFLAKYEENKEKRKLLLRKGVYPYDYMNGVSKMEEDTLPPKEAFYSKLTEEHISDEDYAHAQKVWEVYRCQTMKDYHMLYLVSDVLQLCDVFEHFRYTCRNIYGLDPAHYYTAPGLAWDAMLKVTGVNLQLITDLDMYLMVESGIRGGISVISNKYAKANHPEVTDYNPEEDTSYIMYLDANNLYGWAMSQPLPQGNFKWVPEEELGELDITTIPKDAAKGYILEVDMEYPRELHDLHSDYPLAA